ncbi:alpha-amylase family glycosyl hydrolase [Candidatus Nitrotoga sp. M5]|uniref:alpha-amylase family glycosyl hydrolase n=1 Tax=Candidatus Nitrotoga sp. M5 TaxID=2890409 RepID=UPI001EF5D38A|nr:alpha-amylase family glycosyl hydrolase [Candidatus Nitrotoga sp. M5]CAH1387356.1 1,4-alpha-glucan branching enzyme [Candidatus Nitrotoga sp. M5]
MTIQTVQFQFITGLKRAIFRNARLRGSWDDSGRYSDDWMESPMQEEIGEDGCPIFTASISLNLADQDNTFKWGIILDGPQGANFWGIPTEVQDVNSVARHRQFQLNCEVVMPQIERYYFTYGRRLGANKHFTAGNPTPGLRFGVWAPNAKNVEVVFGNPASGYIADDSSGVNQAQPVITLTQLADGIWEGGPQGGFEMFLSLPYMYRILNAQAQHVYRTDIFSRSQIGRGNINPVKTSWPGTVETLDGSVSCSVVIDADVMRRDFASTPRGMKLDCIPSEEFWTRESTPGLPVPSHLEDLVIYELHVGSLGFGKPGPGDLSDALQFLNHLVELGVNAIELLPMAEFSGNTAWGYGDSHHFCIESSAGGRDKYRHLVRECHRRGIAVIQDVVYNHYDNEAERAQWQYDSTLPEENIYYWYEGRASDYKKNDGSPFPEGGYLDNGSTGFTPRFSEEIVRQQFISSAAFLIEEMHVDGLRVDLTQAIHRDNTLHADGRLIGNANIFGQKFLREWSRTLRMIKPTVMLIAEDHTGWDAVTKLPAQGGLGFSAKWELAFYHQLIGDSDMTGNRARLLKRAGFGGNEPLQLDWFASALYNSRYDQVVFHESHDEAGNASGTARTLVTAVNGAPVIGATRSAAEARSRVCFGLTLLSAGIPMFFMGEEIGAQKHYTYDRFLLNREDIIGERIGNGKALFRFYQDLISLSRRLRSIRSQDIDILHLSNSNRVIAFKRWRGDEEVIIVASFNNTAFTDGYVIEKDLLAIPDAGWKEIFNSDAAIYGGQNRGNGGASIPSNQGRLNVTIPANSFVVLVKQ